MVLVLLLVPVNVTVHTFITYHGKVVLAHPVNTYQIILILPVKTVVCQHILPGNPAISRSTLIDSPYVAGQAVYIILVNALNPI